MNFTQMINDKQILRAIKENGYDRPTAIQEKAIPIILKQKDIIGLAQTGTGKTAAFALPLIELLNNVKQKKGDRQQIKALILSPTRELAGQINDNIKAFALYTGVRSTAIFGGVSQKPQEKALAKGIDILVATPGRLLDLMGQKLVDLRSVSILVLDEADRMLDMGFAKDMYKIIEKLPIKRQTLLFSATISDKIEKIAAKILRHPVKIEISKGRSIARDIKQSVCHVDQRDKKELLFELLISDAAESILIFTRTKRGADKVARWLSSARFSALAIHSSKSQSERRRTLESFKQKRTRILVATDIAARGIDISELSLVVNYDIPNEPEMYIHRIGRTGRAGNAGNAFSFCDTCERAYLKNIQKHISMKIPVVHRKTLAYEKT